MDGENKVNILVVGGGVAGLTCAITVLEHDPDRFGVTIAARDLSPSTISDNAGAVWGPYSCGADSSASVQASVDAWAVQTFERFQADLRADPGAALAAGVQLLPMVHMFSGKEAALIRSRNNRLWAPAATPSGASISAIPAAELPPGVEIGFRMADTPFVDPSRHLQHLLGRFLALGGRLRIATVPSYQDLLSTARNLRCRIVVNAAGLDAATFVQEHERAQESAALRPGAGFFLLCHAPWFRHGFSWDGDHAMSYVIPRTGGVVLVGGTNLPTGVRSPEPGQHLAIMDRALSFYPSLSSAPVITKGCGLRPVRSTGPRCELQPLPTLSSPLSLVHVYGCGGSGYTLCWGMAQTALTLILNDLTRTASAKM